MGVSSIGSNGFSSYTAPLTGGPTVAQPAQQANQAQQAQAADESRETERQQARESEAAERQRSGGNVTATRGQNLNISV